MDKAQKEIHEIIDRIPDDDTFVFNKLRRWLDNVSSVASIRFTLSAKDFLRREENGEKLLKVLVEEDLLLFMLLYQQYSDEEITAIIGDFLVEKDLATRKKELIAQMRKVEMDRELIQMIVKQGKKQ